MASPLLTTSPSAQIYYGEGFDTHPVADALFSAFAGNSNRVCTYSKTSSSIVHPNYVRIPEGLLPQAEKIARLFHYTLVKEKGFGLTYYKLKVLDTYPENYSAQHLSDVFRHSLGFEKTVVRKNDFAPYDSEDRTLRFFPDVAPTIRVTYSEAVSQGPLNNPSAEALRDIENNTRILESCSQAI